MKKPVSKKLIAPLFALAITALAALATPRVAHAETVNLLCMDVERENMIEVRGEFAGTWFDIEVNQPIKGTMRVLKSEGQDSQLIVPFAGTVNLSNLGPAYVLDGTDDYRLNAAAPGSGQPSQLKVGEKTLSLMCD